MLTFEVGGRGTVLGAALSALVERSAPGARVVLADSQVEADAGIRVRIAGHAREFVVRAPGVESDREIAATAPLIRFTAALQDLVTAAQAPAQPAGPTLRGMRREHATERERDVLRLLALGLSNNEIADELMISPNTVRTHLHTLSLKLAARGRTHLVARARARGYLEALALDTVPGRVRIPA